MTSSIWCRFRSTLEIAAVIVLLSCDQGYSQSTEADPAVKALIGHLQWVHYWDSKTFPTAERVRGRTLRLAILRADGAPGLAVCFDEFGVCQNYPNLTWTTPPVEVRIPEGQSLEAAVRLLKDEAVRRDDSFGGGGIERPDVHVVYSTVTFPKFSLPPAAIAKLPRPASEVSEIIELVRGDCRKKGDRALIELAYYREEDPLVWLYRKCDGANGGSSEAILPLRRTEGRWFLGATNIVLEPRLVQQLHGKIRRTLMHRVQLVGQ